MLGLKLLERREPRDEYVVGCLGYFLVIVHFLYSQTPLLVVFMLATVVLLTATLIDLNRREHAPLRPLLRLAATLVGYAVPLMLAAFILFPRISSPLWGLPNDAYSGMSGLSNEMAPGRIRQLSLSDAVAVRVEVEGALPPPQQRYGRGPVFSLTDGERWRGGPLDERERGAPAFVALGAPFRYSVTLEPHEQRWLFARDLPAELPAGARASEEFQLYAPQAVRERQRYTLTSYPDYRTVDMSEAERRRTLQLPAEGSPRASPCRRLARACNVVGRCRASGAAHVPRATLRLHHDAAAYRRRYRRWYFVRHASRLLRTLRREFCLSDARRRHTGAGSHRLSGRRAQQHRQLSGGTPTRCSCVDRGVAGRQRLGAGRPHRRGRARAHRTRHRPRSATRGRGSAVFIA